MKDRRSELLKKFESAVNKTTASCDVISPGLVDDGVQRLRQPIRRQTGEVQNDGGAAAAQTSQIIKLIGEQRDSNQRHAVIHSLVQAVGAAVRHEGSGLWVTCEGGNTGLLLWKASDKCKHVIM